MKSFRKTLFTHKGNYEDKLPNFIVHGLAMSKTMTDKQADQLTSLPHLLPFFQFRWVFVVSMQCMIEYRHLRAGCLHIINITDIILNFEFYEFKIQISIGCG